MLATVKAMTKANPVWKSRRHKPNVAAQATARESVHLQFLEIRFRAIFKELSGDCNWPVLELSPVRASPARPQRHVRYYGVDG
jgi:hypothetical protein